MRCSLSCVMPIGQKGMCEPRVGDDVLVNAWMFVCECIVGIIMDKKQGPVLLKLRYDTFQVPLTFKKKDK